MPLPSPKSDESQSAFISRCMSTNIMQREYEDRNQRVAICYSQWRGRNQNQQSANMQYITNHITNVEIRRTTFNNRTHIIAPVVLMTQGVHNGSAGRILYTAEELSRMPMTWHGRPVPVMHPTDSDGSPRSCNDPDILETQSVGRVFNVEWEPNNGRLKGEIWIDEERTKEICNQMNLPDVVDMIVQGRPVEVSTGLFPEDSGQGGIWNDEEYDASAIGIHADHLALLPGGQGACSWQDGAGIRNQEGEKPMQRTKYPDANNQDQQIQKKQHLMIANQISEGYMELADKLRRKIDSMDNEFRVNFLEDFNDSQIMYRTSHPEAGGDSYYRRSYTIDDDGNVEFGDDVERVNKNVNVTWTPVQQQQSKAQTNNSKEDNSMSQGTGKQNQSQQGNCPEKVEAIINSSINDFAEQDKESLQQLSEQVIDKIPTEEPKAPEPQNSSQEQQQLDLNTILQNTDGELRESIEHGRRLYQQQRNDLISRITQNSGQFTQDELGRMDYSTLEKFANSIKPVVDYSLRGGVGNSDANQEEEEEGLSIPGMAQPETQKQQ